MAWGNEITPTNNCYNYCYKNIYNNTRNEIHAENELDTEPQSNKGKKKEISKITYVTAVALATVGIALMVVSGLGIANCILFGAEFVGEKFALCFASGLILTRTGDQLQEGSFKLDVGMQIGAVTIK